MPAAVAVQLLSCKAVEHFLLPIPTATLQHHILVNMMRWLPCHSWLSAYSWLLHASETATWA